MSRVALGKIFMISKNEEVPRDPKTRSLKTEWNVWQFRLKN